MRDHFPHYKEQVEYWNVEDVQVAKPEKALEQLLEEQDALIREYK